MMVVMMMVLVSVVMALGLHKVYQTVEKPDNACIRGQIFKVKHLVKVEEA